MSGIDYITINLLYSSSSNGLSGMDHMAKFFVYPNPTNGKLTIKNDEISLKGFTLRIHNMNGQLLKTEHIVTDAHEFNLDLHGLNSGCYYYSMSTEITSGTAGKLLIK